ADLVQRFPVESSPEQLVADLADTYVKTIELTMEMRYKNIGWNRFLTGLFFMGTLISVLLFIYNHIIADYINVMDWKKTEDWPVFMYPLMVHFIIWPLCTIPLVFFHRYYYVYLIAANAYTFPLFATVISTGFILWLPQTPRFEELIEHAVDHAMTNPRHLEDVNTSTTRKSLADVYMWISFWAVTHTLICCYTFHMSMRTLSALRYYKNHPYET
ncbi:hypothetical protein PMAYCL1PPCAC_07655, partial [Pristionchus mayeri]